MAKISIFEEIEFKLNYALGMIEKSNDRNYKKEIYDKLLGYLQAHSDIRNINEEQYKYFYEILLKSYLESKNESNMLTMSEKMEQIKKQQEGK